jgi:hypothetical protein
MPMIAWNPVSAFGPGGARGLGSDRQRVLPLRIVRLLPACVQLSKLVQPDGQGLGNPRGRKPRERADEVSGGDELWGFERSE